MGQDASGAKWAAQALKRSQQKAKSLTKDAPDAEEGHQMKKSEGNYATKRKYMCMATVARKIARALQSATR